MADAVDFATDLVADNLEKSIRAARVPIPVGVAEIWLGPGSESQPLVIEPLVIAGVELPITVNLLKAAMLLSLIATLPFVFSAVSEARYRERFFDPIMADMRRAILVRDALSA